MNHLEALLAEYYEWKGFLVRRNIHVGKRDGGGYAGELDIVAYWPQEPVFVLHIEPSLDGDSWTRREERYVKKFQAGRRFIFDDVFDWLDPKETPLKQEAVFVSAGPERTEIAGERVRTIDQYITEICNEVRSQGMVGSNAIPEQYSMLRTLQLALCGYFKARHSA